MNTTNSMRRCRGFVGAFALLMVFAACSGGSEAAAPIANGSVRGNVTDETGAAVGDASVALSGSGQNPRIAKSGADGIYAFTGLASGTYTLTVTPPTGFTAGATGTASVSVAGSAQANVSAFVLSRTSVPAATGSVSGTVKDNTGGAVPGAAVMLSGNAQTPRTMASNVNGVYTFTGVPDGTYTVTVVPPFGFGAGAGSTWSVTVAGGAQAAAPGFVLSKLNAQEARDTALVRSLRARLDSLTQADAFSGAVLVLRSGVPLFGQAYGFADREKRVANTAATQFRIGSMNKMLTAVATLQLVQAGRLNLNATLQTYLPDYPNADLASKVTLHHLLTHTGGTGDIFGPDFTANRMWLREPSDYVNLYGQRSLRFTPGTQWEYSNYGFMLLGAVIERVTGMSFDQYVSANIHTPASMTATGAKPEDESVPGRAVAYTKQLTGTWSNAAQTLPYRGTPAGGGYSTVGDMARFAAGVQEGRLLNAAHTALLLDGKVQLSPVEKYAYGFVDRTIAGKRFVGHSGGAAGMNGELVFEPGGGYVIVVLSNFDPQAAGQVAAFTISLIVTP